MTWVNLHKAKIWSELSERQKRKIEALTACGVEVTPVGYLAGFCCTGRLKTSGKFVDSHPAQNWFERVLWRDRDNKSPCPVCQLEVPNVTSNWLYEVDE